MEFLRRRLGLILRTLISLALIGWLLHNPKIHWARVGSDMLSMDPRWLFAGFCAFLPVIFTVSWRWRMLLRVHGVHLPFYRVFELNMISQYFSAFLIGTTGGDFVKIFYVARAVPSRKAAVAFTVVTDRVIGLIALFLFGVALSLPQLPLLLSQRMPRVFTGLFYLFATGGVLAAIGATWAPLLLRRPAIRAFFKRLPLIHRGAPLFAAYEVTAAHWRTNLLALVASFPSHACGMLMGYCVLRAMHFHPPLFTFFAILLMVNMLISLPVSISGAGVREQLYVYFFALLAVEPDRAVSFSITYFVLNTIWSLIGGPFYFLYRHETHAPAPTAAKAETVLSLAMNQSARDIVERLQRAGYSAYFAGGCVRDRLLGVKATDYDIATSARPEQVQKLFRHVTDLTGKSFGVLRVMHGEETFEVATFRQDGPVRRWPPAGVGRLRLGGRGRKAARLHHQRHFLRSGGRPGDRLRRRRGRI